MNDIMKKIRFYLTAIACAVFTTAIIYSCSSDDYNYADEQKTDQNPLIDYVATSDEFWQFEMCSELLSDKFQAYTSTLNDEEYNKLMESLNDDDYMEEFIEKANLGKELQLMNEAKENLLQHTGFLSLTEEERMLLFRQYAESRELTAKKNLKTRTEGETNKCEEQKQAAYAQAKVDYDSATLKCRNESSSNYCYVQALAKYERDKDIANINYKKCVQNK